MTIDPKSPLPEKPSRKTGGDVKKASSVAKDSAADSRRACAEAEKKAAEYLAGWQRATADYQNLKKETAKNIAQVIQFSNEQLLKELLPIIDYFQYAFKDIPESVRNSSWLAGIEHIRTNFMKVLEQQGVQPIPTVGKKFDPNLHESVEGVESAKDQSGMILEELAPGFTLHGKVIRSAKVKIAK